MIVAENLSKHYGEHKAIIAIETLSLLAGKLPPRALALVMEWSALHQREIALVHSALLELAADLPVRLVVLGEHDAPGGVAVEPVDHAGAGKLFADAGERAADAEERGQVQIIGLVRERHDEAAGFAGDRGDARAFLHASGRETPGRRTERTAFRPAPAR